MKKTLLLFLSLLLTQLSFADELVQDHAHLLSSEAKARLETTLENYAHNTGIEFAVVTVPSLHGREVSQVGDSIKNALGVGNKTSKMGVLYLIAPREKAQSIRVGRGLEPYLTDAESFDILKFTTPKLSENLEQGILARVKAVVVKLQPKEPEITTEHKQLVADREEIDSSEAGSVFATILVILFVLAVGGYLVFAYFKRKEAKRALAQAVIDGIMLAKREIEKVAESIRFDANRMGVNADAEIEYVLGLSQQADLYAQAARNGNELESKQYFDSTNDCRKKANDTRAVFERNNAAAFTRLKEADEVRQFVKNKQLTSRLDRLPTLRKQAMESYVRMSRVHSRKFSQSNFDSLLNPMRFEENTTTLNQLLSDQTLSHSKRMEKLRSIEFALDTISAPLNNIIKLESEYDAAKTKVERAPLDCVSALAKAESEMSRLERYRSYHNPLSTRLRTEITQHRVLLEETRRGMVDYIQLSSRLDTSLATIKELTRDVERNADREHRDHTYVAPVIVSTPSYSSSSSSDDDSTRKNSYGWSSSVSDDNSSSGFSFGGDTDTGGGGASTNSDSW